MPITGYSSHGYSAWNDIQSLKQIQDAKNNGSTL